MSQCPCDVPKNTWTRRLDAPAPDASVHTFSRPPVLEALSLLPVAYRVGSYIYHELNEDREPIFDLRGITLEPPNPGPYGGVPCGGLGSGAIGRGFRGDFRRWSIHPGRYKHRVVDADLFALRVKYLRSGRIESRVLSTLGQNVLSRESTLHDWDWSLSDRSHCATSHALFPRAWIVYDEPLPHVRVTVHQMSPFLPHSYSEASLPCTVFDVEVENLSAEEDIEASVMFVFQNGNDSNDIDACCPCDHFKFATDEGLASQGLPVRGVEMTHTRTRTFKSVSITANQSGKDGIDVELMEDHVGDENHSFVKQSHAMEETRTVTDRGAFAIAAMTERTTTHISQCEKFVSSTNLKSRCQWDLFGICGKENEHRPRPREGQLLTTDMNRDNDQQGDTHEVDQHTFDWNASARELWSAFHSIGDIGDLPRRVPTTDQHIGWTDSTGQGTISYASAVCQRDIIRKASSATNRDVTKTMFSFSLAWDEPLARFGNGEALPKFYTRFFNQSAESASAIATFALQEKFNWLDRITQWQQSTLSTFRKVLAEVTPRHGNQSLATGDSFYDHQLFNELYFLVDGGSLWLDSTDAAARCASTSVLSAAREKLVRTHEHVEASDSATRSTEIESTVTVESHIQCAERQKGLTTEFKSISKASLSLLKQRMLQHDEKCSGCGGAQELVGQFLYLEGHEYLMYNTYDVHFYASFALLQLWPELELSLQRDIALCVNREVSSTRQMMGEGYVCQRKVKGVVPHDVGSPSEYPFLISNAYNFQDVSQWKDLGPKFVLQVCRDYLFVSKSEIDVSISSNLTTTESVDERSSGSATTQGQFRSRYDSFLKFIYPTLLSVMTSMLAFDRDHDGMIENSGFPDQTYDIWTAKGVHAYCGGLWIASCEAIAKLAEQSCIRDDTTAQKFRVIANKAREVYIRELFNGQYLLYDNSKSEHSDSIMADMLAGQWFAMACGLPLVIPAQTARRCAQTIYDFNVIRFGNGDLLGAVNGMRPNGSIDDSCLQSREVWTGTTYGLAATLLHIALETARRNEQDESLQELSSSQLAEMAMNSARGIHDAGWQQFGYWFATPEGWERSGNYRSLGYMRPLCIWAMQFAAQQHVHEK